MFINYIQYDWNLNLFFFPIRITRECIRKHWQNKSKCITNAWNIFEFGNLDDIQLALWLWFMAYNCFQSDVKRSMKSIVYFPENKSNLIEFILFIHAHESFVSKQIFLWIFYFMLIQPGKNPIIKLITTNLVRSHSFCANRDYSNNVKKCIYTIFLTFYVQFTIGHSLLICKVFFVQFVVFMKVKFNDCEYSECFW